MEDLSNMRADYDKDQINEGEIIANPMQMFITWMNMAISSDELEPNMMVLATSGSDGRVSARAVLLKGLEEDGFVFYTNYNSNKAKQIEENKQVAITFNWLSLHKQIRIEGIISKLSEEKSSLYFQSRPKGSQIGAWASAQSSIIESRDILESEVKRLEDQYSEEEKLPKPPHWGGYLIRPQKIEFWQGRSSRLHDRIVFTKGLADNKWKIRRLAP